MSSYLFTSESVGIGHPDKICDQISDAILDEALRQDPHARVACETVVCPGLVLIAGEITTTAHVDYQGVARETIRNIGYTDSSLGFDYRSCGVLLSLNKQSPDIAKGVFAKELGAGDQGIMFGYASQETEELMPLPIMLAHKLVQELYHKRVRGDISYLLPDGKAQVTVEYDENHTPKHIHTVVLSTQHKESVDHSTLVSDMKKLIQNALPQKLLSDKTLYFINPTGRFVIGGPVSDCGFTGRKIIVDTYGGMARHGGGAFSGKDPTKVDRTGAYAARYVAKNIVAAGFAKRCEVQISYAIGIPYPLSIKVDTQNTSIVDEDRLSEAVTKVFDLTPQGMIDMLDLKRPIYLPTAFGGHFGRRDLDLSWEKEDRVDALKKLLL